jgi:transcriptional regulator with XRE-family HTH domain
MGRSNPRARVLPKGNEGGGETSRLRQLRKERDLSQKQLAKLAGMHTNSVANLERGISKEVTTEHANALAAALHVQPSDLELVIRPEGPTPPSVRLRQLTRQQRQLIDELLTVPEEHYPTLRAALEQIRRSTKRKRRRNA